MKMSLGLGLTRTKAIWAPSVLEPVVWYDPSDLSTLFQDAAGTIPVASVGDPVGRVEDRSGNGFHLTASSDAARPTYQASGGFSWLEFDGVDDKLSTAGVLPFSTQSFNCIAFRATSLANSSFPHVVRHRGNGNVDSERHPLLFLDQTDPQDVRLTYGASASPITLASSVLNRDMVASVWANGTARLAEIDGQSLSTTEGTLLDGGTGPFEISGGNMFTGRFYGLVQVNAVPPASQIAATRQWFAERSGGTA